MFSDWLGQLRGKATKPARKAKSPRRTHAFRLTVEALEDRVVPSGTPFGASPQEIQQAYGFNNITFNPSQGAVPVNNLGAGETIAIVDWGGTADLAKNLATFDSAFGLLAPPSFQVLNQTGGTTLPASANGSANGESDLDIEWAHAVAPAANLVFVDANADNYSDAVTAVQSAAQTPGVVAVSMSWYSSEFSGETSYDSYFTTPSGHPGVTFLAAAGDGTGTGVPALSPNVVGVGGTYLSLDSSGNRLSEIGGGGGGGFSTQESLPSYQQGVVLGSNGHRAGPDVSYNSWGPVAVYNSTGWTIAQGTSCGTPQWAALIAIADQGRALNGLGSLNGATQTLPLLYQASYSDFNDMTQGNMGPHYATPGWDMATGLGTPVANLLVPYLAGDSSPGPQITGLSQNTASPGSLGFTLTVTGSNFTANSVVQWNGTALVASYVSPTQLTAQVPAADLQSASINLVTVHTASGPDSGLSNARPFDVGHVTSSVAVSPSAATLSVGATEQFQATAYDPIGMAISPKPSITWSLAPGSVGTISSSGLYSAGPSPYGGWATIQASVGGVTASATINVMAAAGYQYSVTSLSLDPALTSGSISNATAINNSGQIVGQSVNAAGKKDAFLYSGGVMTDLGTLPGQTSSQANGINDLGQVVGSSGTQAFLYSGGGMTNIGTLGGTSISASGINDSGQIVGTSTSAAGTSAFLDSGGNLQGLGMLGGKNSTATAVNDMGQIVGYSNGASGALEPFLDSGGVMQDLGTLGGPFGEARGINRSGQIVGESSTAGEQIHAFLDSGGTMTDLGALLGPMGSNSNGTAINDLGQVLVSTPFAQFLYGNGIMADLSAAVPGWTLTQINGINDSGWIVGTAKNSSGATLGVLLTPPAPVVVSAASPTAGAGNTTNLSVRGDDLCHGQDLTYTWALTGGPAPVTFSANDSNAAQNTTAAFTASGTYTFTVTITNATGQTSTSSVSVNVTLKQTTPTITWAAPAAITFGTPLSAAQLDATANVPGTFVYTPTAGTVLSIGTQTLNVTFTPSDSIDYTNATATTTLTVTDSGPTIVTKATPTAPVVTGTSVGLSVLGSDPAGASTLTYTWSVVSGPAPVFFTANSSNAAQNTSALFTRAGTYTFQATITDAAGLSATSSVNVTVNQTLTSITATPTSATLNDGGTQQFTAVAKDQFSNPLSTQPAFTWVLGSGIGTVSGTGLYTAPITGSGTAVVTAASGTITASAAVTVTNQAPTVLNKATANPKPVTGKTAALSVRGADDGGQANLTYTWSSSGPATVSFSANGSNVAQNTTATFTAAGNYTLTATIKDLGGLSITSSVNVTVNQTLSSITVSPTVAYLINGGTRQFKATASDQFGHTMTTAPTFTWSLVAGGVGGTISSTGLYTAPAAGLGQGTIQAAVGGVTGKATVNIGTPPGTPTNLTASLISPTQVQLSWTPNADNGANFGIWYSTNNGATWTWLTTIKPPAVVGGVMTYTLPTSELPAKSNVVFRVQAAEETYGVSAWSNTSNAVVP